MFPLHTPTRPTTKDDLEKLATHGLNQLVRIPTGAYPFLMHGDYPKLESLEVNLDGASADPTMRVPVPHFPGGEEPAFTASAFTLHAQPLRIASTPVQVQVQARDMQFAFRKDAQNLYWLVPAEQQDAREGSVQVSARQDQLSDLFMSIAAPLAKPYGVVIEDAVVHLEQVGPRSLRASIEATGKKFVMRAKLRVLGQVDIDDQLNARLSNLQAGGDGFLGGIVSNLLEPKLAKVNGSIFPLAGLGLGSLGLRDLQLTVEKDVTIRAAFGKA